jgi:hypothetical protein
MCRESGVDGKWNADCVDDTLTLVTYREVEVKQYDRPAANLFE